MASLHDRLNFFDRVVTPVICYAAGHRPTFAEDIHLIDVEFRKLLRCLVGPPSDMQWARPWHEVLHDWNERVRGVCNHFDIQTWSQCAVRCHWRFVSYVASLPSDRWANRWLQWCPRGHVSPGRPLKTWWSKVAEFCEKAKLGHWKCAAKDPVAWRAFESDFEDFVLSS